MPAWQFTSTHGGLEKSLVFNSSAPLPPHSSKALGKDGALVKALAMSLNPVDYKLAELPPVGRFSITKPSSPGLDFAGKVVATGTNTSATEMQGKIVFRRLAQPVQHGTLAGYTVAPARTLATVPAGVKYSDAACVATAGLTAYQSIAPNVKKGGSGGFGLRRHWVAMSSPAVPVGMLNYVKAWARMKWWTTGRRM